MCCLFMLIFYELFDVSLLVSARHLWFGLSDLTKLVSIFIYL